MSAEDVHGRHKRKGHFCGGDDVFVKEMTYVSRPGRVCREQDICITCVRLEKT